MAQSLPLIDVTISQKRRAILRLIIAPGMAIFLIWLGWGWIPKGNILEALQEGSTGENIKWLFGYFFLISGAVTLLKEFIFLVRSRNSSGHWRILLNAERFEWSCPKHAHGRELSFNMRIDEISHAELRLPDDFEDNREKQYWLHFETNAPIELKRYSGLSLDFVFEQLGKLGIEQKTTRL